MLAGAEIGRYHLEHRIARGGMAEVWAASVRGPGEFVKPVALKFILAHFDEVPEAERLFLQEARLAASFSHANLLSVFDFDRVPDTAHPALAGRYFIAMEKVDGGSLWQLIEARANHNEAIPEAQVAHLAVEILKGMSYLHEHKGLGLIHRDISPQNVLLTRSGQVKVSDFGVAKATAKLAITQSNAVRGKLAYLAPEIIINGAPASASSDLFAVGIVLWEAFSGRALFSSGNDQETLARLGACNIARPESPSGHPASDGFWQLLSRLLRRSPGERFASAADALTKFLKLQTYDPSPLPLSRLVRSVSSLSETSPVIVQAGGTAVLPPNIGGAAAALPRTTLLPFGGTGAGRQAGPVPFAPLAEKISGSPPAIKSSGIPRRVSGHEFVDGFDQHTVYANLSAAISRYEADVANSTEGTTFEEWLIQNTVGGREAIHRRPTPNSFAEVLNWPRFMDLGWKVRLTRAWYGPQPWGENGYWVAEDAFAEEAMVIFPRDLKQSLFSNVTRDVWCAWWASREVDILDEDPHSRKPPVSVKARELLAPHEEPPVSQRAWLKLWAERDPESAGTAIRRKVAEPFRSTNVKRTLWQRVFDLTKR